MDEALEDALNAPVYEIEQFCGDVAEKLLDRHEYASRAEVRMRSEYMVNAKPPARASRPKRLPTSSQKRQRIAPTTSNTARGA